MGPGKSLKSPSSPRWSTFAQTWASFSKSNMCIIGECPEKGDPISQRDNSGGRIRKMELFGLKKRKMGRDVAGVFRSPMF